MNFREDLLGGFWQGVDLLLATWFIWLPIALFILFWKQWMIYIRTYYIQKQGSVLLEIKLPKEVTKSPAAMELVLIQLWQKGSPKNLFETYWDGKVPPWFSFELASFAGEVHFYIWTPLKFKDLIEAHIYAQYPSIEIYEVEDYTVPVTVETHEMWGTYFKFTDPDPFPIKTYVDYGLDRDPDEEFKIEPMTSLVEFFGAVKRGEQVWLQIIIQAHRSEWLAEGSLWKKKDWKDDAKKKIEEIKKEATVEVEGDFSGIRSFTEGQKRKIDAIERSLGKFAFDVCIRGFYIADSDEYFNAANITGLIGSTRQFNSNELNGFKLGWFTDTFYPWQNYFGKTIPAMKQGMLDAYKLRSFHQMPYKHWHQKPLVMTTEEIATMYHFPGEVLSTPTFPRIPSRKAEPPSNLPQ